MGADNKHSGENVVDFLTERAKRRPCEAPPYMETERVPISNIGRRFDEINRRAISVAGTQGPALIYGISFDHGRGRYLVIRKIGISIREMRQLCDSVIRRGNDILDAVGVPRRNPTRPRIS